MRLETPEGWVHCQIGEVTQIVSGGTPRAKDPTNFVHEGGIPWITPADLSGYTNIFIAHGARNLSEKGFSSCSAKKIPEGSVLFSSRAPVGYVAISSNELTTNQGFKSFVLPDGLDSRFIYFYLKYIKPIAEDMATGTTFKELSGTVAAKLPLLIAPTNEQKRIADKLDNLLARVDECRDRLSHVEDILQRFRQSVLKAAVSGKITEDLHQNISYTDGKLSDWVPISFDELIESSLYGPRFSKEDYVPDGTPMIRTTDIGFDGSIDLQNAPCISVSAEEFKKWGLLDGDLLITRTGSTIGKCAIYRKAIGSVLPSAYLIRFRLNKKKVIPSFILLFLLSPQGQSLLVGNSNSVAQPNINARTISQFSIPLPPLEEQEEVVHRTEKLFKILDELEVHCQNAFLKVNKVISASLNNAFRGELVSQNSRDEPASILLRRVRIENKKLKSKGNKRRNIQDSVQKSRNVAMETPRDYLNALSSAFATSSGNNARQLFDRAGFSPEEVVEFYEALRMAPEVRNAFEQSRPEIPEQKQLSITTVADKTVTGDEKFRLIDLWLEKFKNLVDYTVRFDDAHSIDIVLGWNGTGKSNLFEALVVIFRDLHEWSNGKSWAKKRKGFRLRYKISQQLVEITWNPKEMRSPLLKVGMIQEENGKIEKLKKSAKSKLPLPRFIFGYYSGPTNRLAEHFFPMNQNHYNSLRDTNSDDLETLAQLLEKRRFFCAENRHAKYVLLAFFHKEDLAISEFLESRLRIIGFESALFVIRKPRWAKQGAKAEDFWGARGVMRRVMERLQRFAIAPMVVEQNVREGYSFKSEEHYYFFLPDLQSLHALAAEYEDARTFFLALESVDFSELIYDLKIQVRVQATKEEQVAITFHELSEGEQQLLMVLGLMRFTKSHQSLVLLDEPDTHLNPHWSVDYLKLLSSVMSETSDESEEQKTSQILMSTHDPLVIASLLKEQIHLLKRDWQTDVCKWEQSTVDPRGLGFTGILTSEMFGMRSDLDEETLADLDNKIRLIAKEDSLSFEEAQQLEELNNRLEDAGFQKAFSDPYYAAFARAWGRKHSEIMSGTRFLSSEQREEIDRISHELLEEAIAELEAEGVS